MLLHRYGNIDYILNAPFGVGAEIIRKASKEEQEQKIWEMWLSIYPHMSKDTFISYEEYKGKTVKKERKQTDNDMMNMCRMLNAAFGGVEVEA